MRKLKSDNSLTGLVPAVFSIFIFALTSILFGYKIGLDTLGGIILTYAIVFGLWSYLKTQNPNYLVSFAYLTVLGLFMIVFEPGMLKSYGGRLDPQAGFLLVLIYLFLIWLLYLLINKRLKWRGREIMELVAMDVMEGEDSYTDRPRPVGKIIGSRSDITGF